jgi:hypothetical protein
MSCAECKHVYKFEKLNKGEIAWPCSWCDNGSHLDTEEKAPGQYRDLQTQLAAATGKIARQGVEIEAVQEGRRLTNERLLEKSTKLDAAMGALTEANEKFDYTAPEVAHRIIKTALLDNHTAGGG